MWRVHCWLQLVVQDIADDKVPWYKLVTPLTLGTKCLLMAWRWSQWVRGEGDCPPAPTVFNIRQFILKMRWQRT